MRCQQPVYERAAKLRAVRRLRVGADRLLVSEIFESIQGEGPSVGRPSTFLRLGLCNLACLWCDTPYTWDSKRFSLAEELTDMRLREVAERVGDADNLVITGGEPLLQQQALEALLPDFTGRVEIETAATVLPSSTLLRRVAQWNVSPKLGSSGNTSDKRRVGPVLETFARLEHACFKFVVATEEDLEEATALLVELGIPPDRVWLMPEGVDAETLSRRSRWLAQTCIGRGYNLGMRLHVLLWGDERGV